MKQCSKGHLYDDSKNTYCPYCNGNAKNTNTISLTDGYNGGFNVTEALGSVKKADEKFAPTVAPGITDEPFGATVAPDMGVGNPFPQTVSMDEIKVSGIRPVVGWLVVLEGKNKGKDFRIHLGDNAIGKSKTNDIVLDFDEYVSRERCVIITYDDRGNKFYVSKGKTQNNIYINDSILLSDRELSDYDIIEVGKTKLIFRTFCNDKFKYSED